MKKQISNLAFLYVYHTQQNNTTKHHKHIHAARAHTKPRAPTGTLRTPTDNGGTSHGCDAITQRGTHEHMRPYDGIIYRHIRQTYVDWYGARLRGAHSAELEFVSGERERRRAITIGCVLFVLTINIHLIVVQQQ